MDHEPLPFELLDRSQPLIAEFFSPRGGVSRSSAQAGLLEYLRDLIASEQLEERPLLIWGSERVRIYSNQRELKFATPAREALLLARELIATVEVVSADAFSTNEQEARRRALADLKRKLALGPQPRRVGAALESGSDAYEHGIEH